MPPPTTQVDRQPPQPSPLRSASGIERQRRQRQREHDLEIVREAERRQVTGLSKTTWWRWEKRGLVPKRIQLTEYSVGWLRSELQSWISARAATRR